MPSPQPLPERTASAVADEEKPSTEALKPLAPRQDWYEAYQEDDPEHPKQSHLPQVPEIDYAAEQKVLRKLDLYIVPPVLLLYLFSFLDRVNIGNAKLYGMEEDLGLKGSDYQTAVSLLFVTYILSELPSNLVIKQFRPSRWISFLAVVWGIIATLTGLCQSYGSLIACRLLLGLFEGGLFPGLTIYLTLFYSRREIALRVGYLFVSAALAGSVGGLLAYGIGHMDGVAGQRGWRWILIIEGLPTFVLGIATWFWLADDPDSAYYLSPEEKHIMKLRQERQVGYSRSGDFFHKRDMIAALKDWKMWVFCFGQFGGDAMLYGYSTFLPTIIKDIGSWSTAQVQALTIPCYALGAVVYLMIAWLSDRQQKRGIYVVVFALISIIGYAVLIADVTEGVHYFGCFLVALGLYVLVGIPLGWLPANKPRYGARTTSTGLQLTIGNTSGIMAPYLYKDSYGPRYTMGHAVTMALVAMSMVLYAFLSLWFTHLNRVRAKGGEDWKLKITHAESGGGTGMTKSDEEIHEMGDESPRFVYTA